MLVFLVLIISRSRCGLYKSRLEIYRRAIPPADSVGVDSKEWFYLILQVKEVFLEILVSLTHNYIKRFVCAF